MNIYKIYAIIGPWTTPAPAAIMLSIKAFNEAIELGSDFYIAILAGLVALLALEAVGGLSTKEMIRRSMSGEWGWFSVSLIGVIFYVGLGIYVLWGTTSWVYIVMAVFVHVAITGAQQNYEARQIVVQDKETSIKEKQLELDRERERTKQLNAEVRKAKAVQPVVLDSSVMNTKLNKSVQAEQYLNEHPNTTVRELASHLNCSVGSAHGYMKKFKEGLK